MIKEQFLQAINHSYQNYLQYGPRSSKKIIPIHNQIHEFIQNIFPQKIFQIYSYGKNKEYKFQGPLMNKDIDIAVLQKNKPILFTSFKFITGNYNQNSNNYFENMLGECVNIKLANIYYANIIVLINNVPYRNKEGKIIRYEKITNTQIAKYINLINSPNNIHKPDSLSLIILEKKENCFQFADIGSMDIKLEYKKILKTKLSFFSFFRLLEQINKDISI